MIPFVVARVLTNFIGCIRHLLPRIQERKIPNFFCQSKLIRVQVKHTVVPSMEKKEVSDVFTPPEHVKGMKTLDRKMFEKTVLVPTIFISAEKTNRAVKLLKKYLLRLPNLPPVKNCDENKALLLNPNLIRENPHFLEVLSTLEVDLQYKEINLTYENFSQSSILKAVLPNDTAYSVTSFSIIGHITHLNLKGHIKDYKSVIAEVLLDKRARARTIVNKAKTIDNTYRNFEMEVLAGEHDFQVDVKENGLKYEFDFSKVFWNPRLGQEHAEIAKKLEPGDVVFDVFAGVGPFAIPAAKKKCIVYANDLNVEAYRWLIHNSNINKVNDYLTAYNLDGKDFISSVMQSKLMELYRETPNVKVHILMNLPALALEFLPCFNSLLKDLQITENIVMPLVYCYFFATEDERQTLIEKHLTKEMQESIKEVFTVRDVAPKKNMIRLVFALTHEVLFEKCVHENPGFKPKRLKFDENVVT